jgi:hypothetical protein
MGIFDKIVNYFSPPAPPVVQTSPAQKNEGGGDPFFDGLVATVKAGKIPKKPIMQDQVSPYLTKMYAAKKEYEKIHPESKQESSTEIKLKAELKALDDAPIVTDVYTKGIEFGKGLAKTTGGKDVLLAETHDQTAHWDALVGIVAGLKVVDDKRQIIIVNEDMRGSKENKVSLGIEEWNEQTPQQHKKGLGDYFVRAYGWRNLGKYYKNTLSNARKNFLNYTVIPQGHALNSISKLSQNVKYFPIDVNHDFLSLNFATRDAAMAMIWQAIGAAHVVEHKVDADIMITNNRFCGSDLNDPLAEQLIYARFANGEQNAAQQVHSIRVRPTGNSVFENAYNKPVYTNNGAFDEVWHVKPQEQGPNSTWDPKDHVWAKGQ